MPSPIEHFPNQCAEILMGHFIEYIEAFNAVTARAAHNFATCNWSAMEQDTVARLDLYGDWVARATAAISEVVSAWATARQDWPVVKAACGESLSQRRDGVLGETFFNSVTRRMFNIMGIDPELEFLRTDADPDPADECPDALCVRVLWDRVTGEGVADLLAKLDGLPPFTALPADARLCASRIVTHHGQPTSGWVVELLRHPFYRERSAYLIGRIRMGSRDCPLVLALMHDATGIRIDAILLQPEDIRILFSFTRAYFHVKAPWPLTLIGFLRSLMPLKRRAELFIILGHHKHGKSELYRDLQYHQQVCSLDRFDLAPGARGMVMIAFTMAEDDLIYKIIRDRFDSPKRSTRGQVAAKYDYVFRHDRAGRLVDVQTFENLRVDLGCLSAALATELREHAVASARMDADAVVFRSVYVERRVTPLDLFVKSAPEISARAAVIDYGNAIKDMACINIFAGDMLLKNFGVTRLGRVVFYDYDELMPLTDCRFRRIPPPRHLEDEFADEPWYAVADNDVFPEEFGFFLGLSDPLRGVFMDHHADLLDVRFWRQCQQRIDQGEWSPILPYGASQRLRSAVSEPASRGNGASA